ncbi:hypothetical protein V8E51_006231 [Hyaloscypha variabilis]
MYTPQSISSDRPSKRLRLGTKSCAECRRRKVRCIFEPNTTVCKECAAHEAECISQQSVHVSKQSPKEDGQDIQAKLQGLEQMVYRLCEAMSARPESSSGSPFEMSAAEALTRLQSSSSPGTSLASTPNTGTGWREVSEPRSSVSSEQIESFDDAPLLNLFQEAMLIQKHHVQSQRGNQELSSDHRTKIYIKAIKALVPNSADLELILQMTEPFWPIWEDALGLILGWEPHSITSLASAKLFIHDSMKSESPMLVAKSALFLAFCVQQLPVSFKNRPTNLPASPKALVNSYISGADSLISINESCSPTIHGLESLDILLKLYLNMGRPRQAWHFARRALNSAVLLGLHNLEDTARSREKTVWAHIWQLERLLSALLGLPSATTASHPGVSTEPSEQNIGALVLFNISFIAGRIIERNQNHQTVNYAVTLAIDQEAQQFKNRIPSEWWNSLPTTSTPLSAIYGLGILKIEFYAGQKLLHLPYMLKSSVDNNYEYSRLRALDACREIIKAYQIVRQHPRLNLTICDLMDFQAFSAAVVLVINQLNQSSHLETHQESSDWDLVHDVKRSLKMVSEAMECTVAGQGYDVLQHLSTFRTGAYAGPDHYDVTIPMFGRVKISRPKNQNVQPEFNDFYEAENQFQQQFFPMLEFSANAFAPFGMTGDVLSDMELGIDWTSPLNVDYNYDWSQNFDGSLFV